MLKNHHFIPPQYKRSKAVILKAFESKINPRKCVFKILIAIFVQFYVSIIKLYK